MAQGPGKRGHIVANTNVFLFARVHNICCGHKFCVWDTKNVSDFVQKHFVSATNVSQFAQPKKHHGQQCVHNNASSFTRAFNFNEGWRWSDLTLSSPQINQSRFKPWPEAGHGAEFLGSQCRALSTQVYKWVPANLMLG